jgi:hypothetical protein
MGFPRDQLLRIGFKRRVIEVTQPTYRQAALRQFNAEFLAIWSAYL